MRHRLSRRLEAATALTRVDAVVVPRRMQAWPEADELDGRELMRDGRWLKTD
ncbi:hypothetical protein [Streptomyces massasporeus]|uniref:hypothetical protein n=1 Tax=Streptomyces massasporeus TaxID=67324 RepID=UPI003F4D4348